MGIDDKGFMQRRVEGVELVASWPGCPARHLHLRRYGLRTLPLPSLLRWWVEQGIAHRPLSAGGEMLIMEYLRLREASEVLRARRDRERKRIEDVARKASRGGGWR